MKRTILIVIFTWLAACSYGRKPPFELIQKAEAQFEQKNYQKALQTLRKAENGNYGKGYVCGNAVIEDLRKINLLKAQIYIEIEQYENARAAIKDVPFAKSSDNLDSLQIRTYQLQLGSDSLRKLFNSSLTNAKLVSEGNIYQVLIPLSNGMSLEFAIPIHYLFKLDLNDEASILSDWKTNLRESGLIEMIMEN